MPYFNLNEQIIGSGSSCCAVLLLLLRAMAACIRLVSYLAPTARPFLDDFFLWKRDLQWSFLLLAYGSSSLAMSLTETSAKQAKERDFPEKNPDKPFLDAKKNQSRKPLPVSKHRSSDLQERILGFCGYGTRLPAAAEHNPRKGSKPFTCVKH
jgi:hypothetical protein